MHRPSPTSTAIISASQWDILDFDDINKELVNKLTDDDICAVLKCINPQVVLKRLKLCGCVNITGYGLNPLRGSTVLEQIDLSLVGRYDNPHPAPKSKISEEAVVPILDSIISADGCSLKYIQFPYKWCGGSSDLIRDFQERFNELFSTRDMICSKCNVEIRGVSNWMSDHNIQIDKTCYDCLVLVCGDCRRDDVANDGFCLQSCTACDKAYCTDCAPVTRCASCSEAYCKGCGAMEACDGCENANCRYCLCSCDSCYRTRCTDCASFYRCGGRDCTNQNCEECYNGNEYSSVKYCGECENEYCNGCSLKHVKTYGADECCSGCVGNVVPLLLQQNTKLSKEVEEMAKLRKENEELREKVESVSLS